MRANRFEPLHIENARASLKITAVTPQILRIQLAPAGAEFAPDGPLL